VHGRTRVQADPQRLSSAGPARLALRDGGLTSDAALALALWPTNR
jgi:hypothetical protein